ncbi:MAG: hypothetical protein PHT40_00460 [Patescibacteria group bacterium]|nr:hypothetical protein [Patescibacteria group bacterium]
MFIKVGRPFTCADDCEKVLRENGITPRMQKKGKVIILPCYLGGPSGQDIFLQILVWKKQPPQEQQTVGRRA